ncbi:HlyD family type I secretion periplasmic adaptor subunit [Roseovarius sp. MS2]|uniref:HlyD family type I secretion periplasmic adaptor subunit n=1 Tax=Roseovarius TaxID=74030 RepID=UPI003EDC915A
MTFASTFEHDTGRSPQDEFGVVRQLLMAGVLGLALIGGFGGWAVYAQLNSAVIGRGAIKVDRELRLAQHLEGGMLAEILVKPGDRVAAGDIMMRLDTVELETAIAVRRAQLADMSAQAARFAAERDGLIMIDSGSEPQDAMTQELFASEALLLRQSQQERATTRAALGLRRERLQHETAGLVSRQASIGSQLSLAQVELERTRTLVERGSFAPSQLMQIESETLRLAGEQSEIASLIAQNSAQVEEITLEIDRIQSTAALEAHRSLREIEPRLMELRQEITALETRLSRSVIRAPEAGIVNEVPVNTVGQIIAPGETVVKLVPEGADLVIEFQISPTDIDQITIGQEARLKFLSFNQRTTPEILGIVTHVGAASQLDPNSRAEYFLAQALPVKNDALPEGTALMPGMPVEVYVKTASRTPADFFLQPIRDSFRRAMTEE